MKVDLLFLSCAMSLPRAILPQTTYLITRRCAQRQLLLRPSKLVSTIFLYCLAEAASKSQVQVHAFCVLSNHVHLVATDPEARMPEFMHWLDMFVAKCINASLGRWENFWSSGTYSAVRLEDREAVMEKMVYTLTNPVAARLVAHGYQWPGLRSAPGWIGKTKIAQRPRVFFRPGGKSPASSALIVSRPPSFAHLSDQAYSALLQQAVEKKEEELRQQAKAKGDTFLGRKAVLAQSPYSMPRTHEPRRHINPRIATRDKWRRIEALQSLRSFLEAYRKAWQLFRDGIGGAVFPAGTYWLRIRFGVACAGFS